MSFYDGYEAFVNGAVGAGMAYLRGIHKGQALLMEFGEKALINILATSVSKYWPLMGGATTAQYVDMDREYLLSALFAAMTKSWKKRSGVSLAGEQALISVLAHRLSMGSTGYAALKWNNLTGSTASNSGSSTGNPT